MGRVSAVLGSLSALLCCAALMLAPAAGAQQIVVGQTAPSSSSTITCEETLSYVEFQSSIAAGNSYVFPSSGLVTSWSVFGGSSGSQAFGVKILRPVFGNSYKVVGGEVGFSLAPGILNTYPLSVQVEAGDILGVQYFGEKAPCIFETGLSGDRIRWDQRIATTSSTVTFDPENTYAGYRTNISATLLPPPVISMFGPVKGSIKGDKVVIYGANFADVRSVKFGESYAKSFIVESEGQITAYAPWTTKLEKNLPLSVTTGAGVATSAQTYSYVGCKVPPLFGKKLKPAKRALKRAGCKLGKVTKLKDATARTGRVLRQHPSAGTIRTLGTRVKLTLRP